MTNWTSDLRLTIVRSRFFGSLPPILLLIAFWISTHPYRGIFHDARYYLIQAINANTGQLGRDLYFEYGDPGQFTLASSIYKYVVEIFGPPTAHLVTDGIGQTIWFVAMIYFACTIFTSYRPVVLACLGIIILYPFYGVHIFRYGEYYATPRLYAEALILIALALVYRRRLLMAALIVPPAFALHPVMAAPAAAMITLLLAQRHRVLWWAYAALIGVALILAGANVEPFARAFALFDPAWLDVAYQRCFFAFVTAWPWWAFVGPLANGAVFVIAWQIGSAKERRLLGVVAFVGVGGLVTTLIGGDLAKDVLVVDVQPWRALWIVALLANAWTLVAAERLPRTWLSRDLLWIGVICQAVLTAAQVRLPAASPIFLLALISFGFEWRAKKRIPRPVWYGLWSLAAVIIANSAILLYFSVRLAVQLPGAGKAALGLAIIVASLVLLLAEARVLGTKWAESLLSIVLLLLALITIDRRDPWQKFIENEQVPESLVQFSAQAPNIYWEQGVELLWFKLGRPSYYSCIQGTGAQFYRATALEFQRRSEALAGLNTGDFSDVEPVPSACAPRRNADEDGPKRVAQLAAACRALPELDAIVLMSALPGSLYREWHAPVGQPIVRRGRVYRADNFYRYDCANYRTN